MPSKLKANNLCGRDRSYHPLRQSDQFLSSLCHICAAWGGAHRQPTGVIPGASRPWMLRATLRFTISIPVHVQLHRRRRRNPGRQPRRARQGLSGDRWL